MSTVTLRPDGAGDDTNWTPNTGANYATVDESENDADTTYVARDGTEVDDLYAIATDAALTGATISNVRVYASGKYVESGSGTLSNSPTLKLGVKSWGTEYWDAGDTITSSYADYYQDWATNPADSAAWEKADIDALQVGIRSARTTGTGSKKRVPYVTQVWVVVTYTAGATYTLAMGSGSYSQTGQAVSLLAGRKLTIGQGSHTLTGQAVSLLAGRKLTVGNGSYSLTGQAVILLASRIISIGYGSYALTGQDVDLVYSGSGPTYTLAMGAGSYALTGQAVGLLAGRKLAVAQGGYALTGQAVVLSAGRKLSIGYGNYAVVVDSASLIDTILAPNPILYMPMNELTGTTMVNYGSLGAAANGTYNGVTLNQIDAPGGGRAGLWDGVNDYGNVYSAALNGGINFNTVTVLQWVKIYNAAAWGASALKFTLNIGDTAAPVHYLQIVKNTLANQFYLGAITYGATSDYILKTSLSNTDWFLSAFTVDKAADQMKVYYNGTQEGATQTGIGAVSSPVLTNTSCIIGAQNTGGSLPWYGYLAHAAIYDKVLTADEIATIYNAGIGVGTDWTNLYANRKLSIGQGAYTLAGQNVGLVAARKLSIGQGAYALTGQDIDLLAGRKLSLAQGSYTLTGQDVSILARRLLALGYGVYTLTGQPVTFDVTLLPRGTPAPPRKDRGPVRIGGRQAVIYRRRRAEDEEY